MKQFLNNLELTLNAIEVKGEQNLNRLLGCILAVKQAKQSLGNEETEGENGRQDNQ